MSKEGYKGITLRHQDTDKLELIGNSTLGVLGIAATPAATIRYLIAYFERNEQARIDAQKPKDKELSE